MKKCLVIMNHRPTEEQLDGLKDQFGIKEVLELPDNLRSIWAQIPPAGEFFPEDHLQPLLAWIGKNAVVGDHIWFQGEAGATVLLRSYCFGRGLTPIYATTRREAVEVENPDGSVTKKSIFRHVNFRYYP